MPTNQLNHPKDVYIFGFLLGNVVRDPDRLPDAEDGAYACGLAWAFGDEVPEWRVYPKGSRLFPYLGTQTENRGTLVQTLRSLDVLLDEADVARN